MNSCKHHLQTAIQNTSHHAPMLQYFLGVHSFKSQSNEGLACLPTYEEYNFDLRSVLTRLISKLENESPLW